MPWLYFPDDKFVDLKRKIDVMVGYDREHDSWDPTCDENKLLHAQVMKLLDEVNRSAEPDERTTRIYREAADDEYGRDGELEFDSDAVVSMSDGGLGAYVMGWRWVYEDELEGEDSIFPGTSLETIVDDELLTDDPDENGACRTILTTNIAEVEVREVFETEGEPTLFTLDIRHVAEERAVQWRKKFNTAELFRLFEKLDADDEDVPEVDLDEDEDEDDDRELNSGLPFIESERDEFKELRDS